MGNVVHGTLLQDETSAELDGNVIDTDHASKLLVCIYGTATSATVNFKMSPDLVNYFSVEGVRMDDSTITANNTTTAVGEAWLFDCRAYRYFKAPVVTASGGYVSILASTLE